MRRTGNGFVMTDAEILRVILELVAKEILSLADLRKILLSEDVFSFSWSVEIVRSGVEKWFERYPMLEANASGVQVLMQSFLDFVGSGARC